MGRILYIDCTSGISGDKTLGAFVDLGLTIEELRDGLARLPLTGYSVDARPAERAWMRGTQVIVEVTGDHGHRGRKEIMAILDGSSLATEVRELAARMFERILVEEARIHGIPVDRVHLHEVGAVDAIVDIVGTAIAVRSLGPERIVCSPINVGSGVVSTQHGTLPVPAPATAELLKGAPITSIGPTFELTTPTGAVIATTLAGSFGALPAMTLERIGYGAGGKDFPGFPNLLRLLVGRESATGHGETIEVETNVDDCSPQILAHAMERLFEAGAHDVFFQPIQMKKNRPGTLIRVIASRSRLDAIARVVFRETSSIGLRHRPWDRITLARRFVDVATPWGDVPVKVSSHDGEVVQATPEYDVARRLALAANVPLARVLEEALAAFRRLGSGGAA